MIELFFPDTIIINTNIITGVGGGKIGHATRNLLKKYPCSHNNNIALIKQISLFDTALVMTNTSSFNSKYKKKILLTNRVKLW